MADSATLWVLDSSILVSFLRSGKYARFIAKALRNRSLFLPGVAVCELFAGAVTRSDRSDLEAFRRAVGTHILLSQIEDWLLTARCLAHYSARWGKIIPRDHLADVIIAVTAAKLNATVASENVSHMVRWKWVLKKLGFTLRIGRLEEIKNQ